VIVITSIVVKSRPIRGGNEACVSQFRFEKKTKTVNPDL